MGIGKSPKIRKHQDKPKTQNVLMMNTKIAQTLSQKQFKRRFGVQRDTFKEMLKVLQPLWRPIPVCGAKPKLTLSAQILVTLEYLREYRTYFHIGSSWGVSESTICRVVHWVEDRLMRSGRFRVPGKKHLLKGFGRPDIVVMDVTETPIERPTHRQRRFYSGKKKQHTLKTQVLIDRYTGQVICLYFGKGRQHDFKLFQSSGVRLHPDTQSLQDKGYQGIQNLHDNSRLPIKKPKGGKLNRQQKAQNRELARERIGIEHVNRRFKTFRILGQRYRNRRRRYGLRCNLIAALYNFELAQTALES
jgi:DDE superfamily endonuclease/Helix-turn-helix of DDE superfamily endonuclease